MTAARPHPRRSPSRRLTACLASRRAVVALEYALAAPILLMTVLGIIGLGIYMLDQAALERATLDAARLIRTGQVQTAGGAESAFTTRLCDDVSLLMPCSALQVNVQAANDFTALSDAVPVSADGAMQDTTFNPGTPGQDVLVQVGYQPGFPFSWLGVLVGSGSDALVLASVAFQNEMY
jgi:Flp pilus assembly protein TadG